MGVWKEQKERAKLFISCSNFKQYYSRNGVWNFYSGNVLEIDQLKKTFQNSEKIMSSLNSIYSFLVYTVCWATSDSVP